MKNDNPNTARMASYRLALRRHDEHAAAIRMLALQRDWHRQRDANRVLRRFVTHATWMFAFVAFVSALSIVTRVL